RVSPHEGAHLGDSASGSGDVPGRAGPAIGRRKVGGIGGTGVEVALEMVLIDVAPEKRDATGHRPQRAADCGHWFSLENCPPRRVLPRILSQTSRICELWRLENLAALPVRLACTLSVFMDAPRSLSSMLRRGKGRPREPRADETVFD